MEFYETFDNGDFYKYLEAANEKARDLNKATEVLSSADSLALAAVNTAETTTAANDTTGNSLISGLSDSLKVADQAEFMKQNPLFALLTPNIDREGRINQQGSTVGLARLKDTSAIINYWHYRKLNLYSREMPNCCGQANRKGMYWHCMPLKSPPETEKLRWTEVR